MALLAEPDKPFAPVARHGVVVEPPAALGDSFTVQVPDFDDLHVFEIRRWEYRGAALPETGDEVLVAVDDIAEPWVVTWWPASGDPPGLELDAGAGLTLTGSTLAVGAGAGITVAADTVGITPEGITQSMLAVGAVGTSRIANLAVTAEKLATGAVTLEKLAVGSVSEDKFAAPTWINVKDPAYGAVGNNTADDTAAINKAIAALPVAGGTIFFPRGAYKITAQLSLEGKRSVRLVGVGAMSSGATPASLLVFAQEGAGAAFNLAKTSGVTLTDLTCWITNKAFTGPVLDFTESAYMMVERCNLAGIGEGKNAKCGLELRNAQLGRFRDVHFGGMIDGARGKTIEADFSNVMEFECCAFINLSGIPLRNPSDAWTMLSTNFQPLTENRAGAMVVDAGLTARSAVFVNCGMYDAEVKGTWITWRGWGLSIRGGIVGNGVTFLSVPDAASVGVHVGGVFIQGTTVGINIAEGVKQISIDSDIAFSGVTEPIVVAGVSHPAEGFSTAQRFSGAVTVEGAFTGKNVVWATRAAAASGAFQATVQGDVFARYGVNADGKIQWGDGTKAADVALYRAAADVLALDDQLRIVGASGGVAMVQRKVTDESARFRLTELGVIELGDGTAAGLDVNLYRAAANSLKTDDSFTVAGAKTLIQPAAADGADVFRVNNKAAAMHLAVNTETGVVELGRRATITASSASTMLAVNQQGAGPVADLQAAGASVLKIEPGPKIGAFGAAPAAKPAVTGSRAANAALTSLLTALATLGWITNSTTA